MKKSNFFKRALSTVLAATLAVGMFVFTANAADPTSKMNTNFTTVGGEAEDAFVVLGELKEFTENKKFKTLEEGDILTVIYQVYGNPAFSEHVVANVESVIFTP